MAQIPPEAPHDILVRVAEILAAREARGTLSALSRASRGAYDAAAPALYAHLVLSPRAAGLLSSLSASDVAGFPGFDDDGRPGNWAAPRATLRRLAALSHVRRCTISALPRDHESVGIAEVAPALPPGLLFPKLAAVSLGPVAVDQLRIWTPDYAGGPSNPPILEALATQRPVRLCVAFRQVPAAEWEAYRDASTRGQYALVRRLELLSGSWGLESVTFHDIVHQVPPSLPTHNVYDFAPPAVPHPFFRSRYRFPRGREAVRLPGPEWNMRPWQMGIAIKNLFPSNRGLEAHMDTLAKTRWSFCDVGNHILTKEERDDDDGTGVWYAEVKDMIQDSIRAGMARDLPARGLDRAFVDEVFDRVEYRRIGVCEACDRECESLASFRRLRGVLTSKGDPDEHCVMSMDGLDML